MQIVFRNKKRKNNIKQNLGGIKLVGLKICSVLKYAYLFSASAYNFERTVKEISLSLINLSWTRYMWLLITPRYETYTFLTDRQLKWISACITSYRYLALQSQLMTCKTITKSLICITEFSLSISQYLVLWILSQTMLARPGRGHGEFRIPSS